jgi:FkbM family methyltransferase
VAAAKKSPRGTIYAYEPFADSFELLTENIRLNQVGNVSAFPYAVGASVRPMHLNLGTGVPVLHSTVANESDASGPVVSVKGTSLDEVFQVHSIERCDLLKIDCEGAEFDILFNAHPHTLARINRICLEYHNGATPFSHPDLVRFLERGDFNVAVRPSPVHAHTGLLYAIK